MKHTIEQFLRHEDTLIAEASTLDWSPGCPIPPVIEIDADKFRLASVDRTHDNDVAGWRYASVDGKALKVLVIND